MKPCTCFNKAPTVPVFRDATKHLDDCPAKDSGQRVGINPAMLHPQQSEIELAEARREIEQLRDLGNRQSREIENLRDLADAVEVLRDIGRVFGCGHVDDPDGRRQLVTCIDQEFARVNGIVASAREQLQEIVCVVPPDDGVVLLSNDSPCHPEERGGYTVQVYNHKHFSPLGDALMALHAILSGEVPK
jgi:hypothetical protein